MSEADPSPSTERRRRPAWVWLLLGGGMVAALATVGAMGLLGYGLWETDHQVGRGVEPKSQPWERIEVPYPDGTGKLLFERRDAEPRLAEPDRRVRLADGAPSTPAVPLPPNVGGRTRIEVFWHRQNDGQGPWFRLVDRFGAHVVDVRERTLAPEVPDALERPGRYLGLIDGRTDPLRFRPGAEPPSEPTEADDGGAEPPPEPAEADDGGA